MLVRVNVETKQITKEALPKEYENLGGRGLIAKLLTDEVDPRCDALGRKNKFIIAPGLLGGTIIPGANRLSTGTKSPLTGGIKESNAGGNVAIMLGMMGIKALVIEGLSNEDKWYVLYVSQDKIEFNDGSPYLGKGIYERSEKLIEDFGKNKGYMMIGPAGEQLLQMASVAVTDQDGRPNRFAARGGIGSVLGSKRILGIVVDPGRKGFGRGGEALIKVAKELGKLIVNNPLTSGTYPDYGTASVLDITNELGGLPTRNFSRGKFEHAKNINAETLRKIILSRGGEGTTTHACMPGCIVRCSNIYPDSKGKELVSPLEYETIALLGSNCGIGNLDDIAYLNKLCNDIGIDTIEAGATLGVMMEAGVLQFGDTQAAAHIIKGINNGELTSKLFGLGVNAVGKALGLRHIPVSKGQALAGYDPRALKGLGVTYATSAMGADHTAGNNVRAPMEHHKKDGQVEASLQAQLNSVFYDNLGVCLFVSAATKGKKEIWAEAVSAVTGREVKLEKLEEIAKNILIMEREFNRLNGICHDALPEWFYEEPNPDTNSVFDLTDEDLSIIKNL